MMEDALKPRKTQAASTIVAVAKPREGRAPSRPRPRQSAALPNGNGGFATASIDNTQSPILMAVLRLCAVQTLVFPVLTVLLASLSFIAGGACSVWQWWVAFLTALAYPFFFKNRRVAIGAGLAFLLIVLGVVLICKVQIDPTWVDNDAYHLPGTRLLVQGWNPLCDATPEKIGAAFAINPFDMRVWHVLCVHKAVWIFNAVATLFHGDALAATYPAGYFVFIAVALFVFTETSWHWIVRFCFVCLLWRSGFNVSIVVDTVVGLSGVGLLIAMRKALVEKATPWPYLLGFSFWMMNAKASGALACFAMWLVFSMFLLYRYRQEFWKRIKQLLGIAAVLTACFVVACASPYVSSWREYGHPLYPAMTVDESKYPKQIITDDIVNGNHDFQTMGRVGYFVNAYVSPKLACAYYNWRLKRNNFKPMNRAWYVAAAEEGEPTATCPTTQWERIRIWLAVLALLLLPGGRLVACATVAALLFVPPQYFGYMRYFPWLNGIEALALILSLRYVFAIISHGRTIHVSRTVVLAVVALVVLAGLPHCLLSTAIAIDQKLRCFDACPHDAYVNVYGDMLCTQKDVPEDLCPRVLTGTTDSSREGVNSIVLLSRIHVPLKDVKIIGCTQKELSGLHKNPLGFFEKNKLKLTLEDYNSGGTRLRRFLCNYPVYTFKMYVSGFQYLIGNSPKDARVN